YLEQRELDAMEQTLLDAEERLEWARQRAHDPKIATDAKALQERFAELTRVQDEVDRLYARWSELESKSGSG
ncbi:MAG TPA: ABC transporter C-terminal domain-containing protein, partial [Thermoanaerobaculia bacterium]